MKLTLEGGRTIRQPDSSEIQTALAVHASTGGGFAILSRDEQTYIQAAGDEKSGFRLEYQEGDTDHHFACARNAVPLADVIQSFQSYAAGDEKWRTMLAWVKLDAADFRRARGCKGSAAAMALAFAAGTVGLVVTIGLVGR